MKREELQKIFQMIDFNSYGEKELVWAKERKHPDEYYEKQKNIKYNNKSKGIRELYNGKFTVSVYANGKKYYLGTYNTEEEAIQVYKKNKEELTKENKQ